jgi:hypothetical protein
MAWRVEELNTRIGRDRETERRGGRPIPVRLSLDGACLEFGAGLEEDVADAALRGDVVDRPQEREGSPLAIYGVLHNRQMKTDTRSGSSVGRRRCTSPDRGETVGKTR